VTDHRDRMRPHVQWSYDARRGEHVATLTVSTRAVVSEFAARGSRVDDLKRVVEDKLADDLLHFLGVHPAQRAREEAQRRHEWLRSLPPSHPAQFDPYYFEGVARGVLRPWERERADHALDAARYLSAEQRVALHYGMDPERFRREMLGEFPPPRPPPPVTPPQPNLRPQPRDHEEVDHLLGLFEPEPLDAPSGELPTYRPR
jgi:hypothetical protein